MPSTYTTAYLIGALLFVPVWLVAPGNDHWHHRRSRGPIYSVGKGGYMAALYGAIFRGQPVQNRARPGWLARLTPLAAISLLPPALFYGLGIHSLVGARWAAWLR